MTKYKKFIYQPKNTRVVGIEAHLWKVVRLILSYYTVDILTRTFISLEIISSVNLLVKYWVSTEIIFKAVSNNNDLNSRSVYYNSVHIRPKHNIPGITENH